MFDGIQKRYVDKRTAPAEREAPSCDAGRVVDATVRVLREVIGRDTDVRVILNGTPTVRVPQSVLGQIVLNLVTNAAQAAAEVDRPDRLVTVAVDIEGPNVVLRLADTGPGIRAEVMDRIFEPYFTTKSSGTGLGLSIVRDLVESAENAGATFEVRLPAAPPPG
jgi:signal transduction histidine kinase